MSKVDPSDKCSAYDLLLTTKNEYDRITAELNLMKVTEEEAFEAYLAAIRAFGSAAP